MCTFSVNTACVVAINRYPNFITLQYTFTLHINRFKAYYYGIGIWSCFMRPHDEKSTFQGYSGRGA